MKVNIQHHYPDANYPPYLAGGYVVNRPANTTLEVGMLMYDKENNSIGIILGCIDEEKYGEVRLDSDGMRPISCLRPAVADDFLIKGVEVSNSLKREFQKSQRILECCRQSLVNEDISYAELFVLQTLKDYILEGDVQLLEAANVREDEK